MEDLGEWDGGVGLWEALVHGDMRLRVRGVGRHALVDKEQYIFSI